MLYKETAIFDPMENFDPRDIETMGSNQLFYQYGKTKILWLRDGEFVNLDDRQCLTLPLTHDLFEGKYYILGTETQCYLFHNHAILIKHRGEFVDPYKHDYCLDGVKTMCDHNSKCKYITLAWKTSDELDEIEDKVVVVIDLDKMQAWIDYFNNVSVG